MFLIASCQKNGSYWALSIQPEIPEIQDGEANGTEIFRAKIPEFWVYLPGCPNIPEKQNNRKILKLLFHLKKF